MVHEHGGVYTCTDRAGQIYSADKSVCYKDSTFKCPFHVPRCLIMVDQMMTQILGE